MFKVLKSKKMIKNETSYIRFSDSKFSQVVNLMILLKTVLLLIKTAIYL